MSARRMHVLMLYWTPGGGIAGSWNPRGGMAHLRPAIRHHLQFLESSPAKHRISYWDVRLPTPALLGALGWDAIVLHNSLLCLRWSHLFANAKWRLRWLAHVRCPVVAMPQDEYDHAHVLDEWLAELGVAVVCSNFGAAVRPQLYPLMHTRATFRECYTGYLDGATTERWASRLHPAAERPLDLVYRAAHLPYWFGSHGQLKHEIATVAAARVAALGLRGDLSTRGQDTITGDAWFAFLASARAVLGCESGSSVLDRRGEVQARIRWLLGAAPDLSFAAVSAQMPSGWDAGQFYAVGPRHFEAVLTRTCQVLVAGRYDGILRAGVHYLPLRRDLADLDDVLGQVRDAALVDRITTRAYEDVCLSGRHTYATLADTVEQAIATPMERRFNLRQLRRRILVRGCVGIFAVVSATFMLAFSAWHIALLLLQKVRGSVRLGLKIKRMHGLAFHRPAARRLWRGALFSRACPPGLAVTLWKDLTKLAVLRACLGSPRPDQGAGSVPIMVGMTGDRLVFTSWPAGEMDASFTPGVPGVQTSDLATVQAAIRDGLVKEVWWDYSRVGSPLRYAAPRKRCLELYMGRDGVHRFGALNRIGQRQPENFHTILLDVLEMATPVELGLTAVSRAA